MTASVITPYTASSPMANDQQSAKAASAATPAASITPQVRSHDLQLIIYILLKVSDTACMMLDHAHPALWDILCM